MDGEVLNLLATEERQRDRILEIYTREVMAEEVLDREGELELMREIRRMEVDRWVELLCDLNGTDTIESSVIREIKEKKIAFDDIYKTLDSKHGAQRYLHPDTIWNIDVLDACIAQLKHRFIRANLRLVVEIAKRYDFGLVSRPLRLAKEI